MTRHVVEADSCAFSTSSGVTTIFVRILFLKKEKLCADLTMRKCAGRRLVSVDNEDLGSSEIQISIPRSSFGLLMSTAVRLHVYLVFVKSIEQELKIQ